MSELIDNWNLKQSPNRAESGHTPPPLVARATSERSEAAPAKESYRYEACRGRRTVTHTAAQVHLGRWDRKTTPTHILRPEEILSYLWLELVHHDVERTVGRCDVWSLAVVRDVGVPVVAAQRAVHVGRSGEHGVEEVHFVGERFVRVDLRVHGDRLFFFTCCAGPLSLSSRYVNSKKQRLAGCHVSCSHANKSALWGDKQTSKARTKAALNQGSTWSVGNLKFFLE